jgi:3-deoxy-D-manno-octulosonic-acid transferase
VLTFFSPSGYEIRKNYPNADIICYLPVDTKMNAIRFLDAIHPEMAFFVKYEFWYHHLTQLKKRNVPVYLISGIFRREQIFFSQMPWGRWYRKFLGNFTHFFLQDQNSARLLEGVGFRNCTISGDTRFDRVSAIAKSSQPLPIVEKFSAGHQVLVAGSTWKPDEELIVPVLEGYEELKVIIAPHEVTEANIHRLMQLLKTPAILYSQSTEKNVADARVLVIDSVGLLSSVYRYGNYAWVGGGFGVGIHNILEPATFGMPIFFGPNFSKFREACQLVEKGAAFSVTTSESFRQQLAKLMYSPEERLKAAGIARGYVKENAGATKIITDKVFS